MKIPKYEVILSKRLDNTIGILIQEESYKDVLLSINSFKTDELSDEAVVEFYVVNKPKSINDEDLESEDFKDLFNSIMQDLLEGAALDPSTIEDIETFDS